MSKTAMALLLAPQCEFRLARHPSPANGTFRAWDAADGFLLRCLDIGDLGAVLLVNVSWGALSTALAACRPQIPANPRQSRIPDDATGRLLNINDLCDIEPPGSGTEFMLRLPRLKRLDVRRVSFRIVRCYAGDLPRKGRNTSDAKSIHKQLGGSSGSDTPRTRGRRYSP
jgi:hypothetical protein